MARVGWKVQSVDQDREQVVFERDNSQMVDGARLASAARMTAYIDADAGIAVIARAEKRLVDGPVRTISPKLADRIESLTSVNSKIASRCAPAGFEPARTAPEAGSGRLVAHALSCENVGGVPSWLVFYRNSLAVSAAWQRAGTMVRVGALRATAYFKVPVELVLLSLVVSRLAGLSGIGARRQAAAVAVRVTGRRMVLSPKSATRSSRPPRASM